jgi:hypothetical protein
MMPLIDSASRERLLANGRNRDRDHHPVIKIFNPTGSEVWLLSELDPQDQDTLFGLCDLGKARPEMGTVSLAELLEVSASLPIGLERDMSFWPVHPLSVYARVASRVGRITEERCVLSMGARG